MDQTIVITNTNLYQVLSIASALAIEINTGMGHSRGSVMLVAKRYCGSVKRTKKGVLRDYTTWLASVSPGYTPNGAVVRALGLETS